MLSSYSRVVGGVGRVLARSGGRAGAGWVGGLELLSVGAPCCQVVPGSARIRLSALV